MTEIVAERRRHSATYDIGNGQRQIISAMAPLHYEAAPNDWRPVDLRLSRIGSAYVATGNDFHVGIEPSTGWMRMAPRGGAHSVDLRVAAFGYYIPSTGQWTTIGTLPDYANLTQFAQGQTARIAGEDRHVGAFAGWRNLYGTQYPVDVALRVNADRFKIGVRVSNAALTYLVQQIPQAARSSAWFAIRYEMRLSNIPGAKTSGGPISLDDTAEEGLIELLDGVGQTVAVLNADVIYDEAIREDMPPRVQMRRRIYTAGNAHYLVSGLRVTDLTQFQSADWVVFDPTITSTTTDPDDGTDRDTFFDAGFCQNGTSIRALIRFQNVTVPNGATISDAHIDFYQQFFYGAGTWNVIVKESDNHPGWSDTERYYAGLSWHATGGTTFSWTSNVDGLFTADATDPVQYVVNRAGWASGNAMGFSINRYSGGTGRIWDVDDNPSLAAILSVTYSASSYIDGSGTASATSSATGAAAVIKSGTGTASGTSSATGAASVLISGTGTASATSSATGSAILIQQASGTASAASAATGSASVVKSASGTATATAEATGAASAILSASGTAAATSAATGAGAAVLGASGTASATTETTGAAAVIKSGAGTASATSSATGTGNNILAGSGTASATSSATGDGEIAGGVYVNGSGTATATSAATGAASVIKSGAGTATSTSSTSGAASVILAAAGTATATTTATGLGNVVIQSQGTASATSDATGSNVLIIEAAGIAAATATTTGAAIQIHQVSGTATATSSVTGSGGILVTGTYRLAWYDSSPWVLAAQPTPAYTLAIHTAPPLTLIYEDEPQYRIALTQKTPTTIEVESND